MELSVLDRSDRWRAEFHIHGGTELFSEKHRLRKLGDVVTLSVDAADPATLDASSFYYVGLENIEPVTGDAMSVEKISQDTIRSRSRVFRRGDVLYGRLRPYLRKALLVDEKYSWGLCSTELLVLRPNASFICGVFLRELLVSKHLTNVICRLQSGAALPRVSADDLLSLEVPIPPLQEQEVMATAATSISEQRRSLKAKLKRLSEESECVLSGLFTDEAI